jgi:2-methylisocitrate lyase-like PEP mutase family enzyme
LNTGRSARIETSAIAHDRGARSIHKEMTMSTQLDKADRFKALHERRGAFVIPNPWDIGSARVLAGLGFEALATTSSGFANAIGVVDGEAKREQVIEHCRQLAAATHVPLSADLEDCFADDPRQAAQTIVLAGRAGAVGGSIEDYSGESKSIYDFSLAVERVHAAVEAARSLGFPFTLTARAENLLRGRDDLDDTIRRLQAFEAAGADVLFAPGLKTLEQVRVVTSAVSKPVNVLGTMMRGVTVPQLADAGVRRISIGGALARAATSALVRAGTELRDAGGFGWMADFTPNDELARLLRAGADK